MSDLCTAVFKNDINLTQQILERFPSQLDELTPWNTSLNKPVMIDSTMNLHTVSDIYNALPLNLAVIYGHIDIVRLLLKAGSNPSKIDSRAR